MLGALIGDISGSRFEWKNHKSKEFELFDQKCKPTDDSIMSLAIAKALLESQSNHKVLSANAIHSMQELGKIYKNAGYGGSFIKWIMSKDPQPYNSYGNGSAMRVGPCGYVANSIEEAKVLSAKVTQVSHNHPEGMKGAEAIAVAIYLAKSGKTKDEIKDYIIKNYYEIDFTLEQIRDTYKFDVSCQGSVPVALEAFLEANDFEDAIRNAISVGGDSDTIAAIAGSVAEAYYGIPKEIIESAIDYLDSREMEILYYFEKAFPSKALDEDGKATCSVFDIIDDCVDKIIPKGTKIEVDSDSSSDEMHANVNKEDLIPDFSSFDKSDKTKNDKSDFMRNAQNAFKSAGDGGMKAINDAKEGLIKALDQDGNGIIDSTDIIIAALKVPGVKIPREEFLKKELFKYCTPETIQKAIDTTPAEANIDNNIIEKIADDVINFERIAVSGISTALGIPGGYAMIATIPADIAQYYAYMLRAAQKLLYLYGFPEIDISEDGLLLDSGTLNSLTVCLGVMYGVAAANNALKAMAQALAVGVEKQLLKKALTKGTIYPIVKSVAKWFSVKMTKEVFAGFFKKAIPVVGGVVGGGVTFFSFKPCCHRLQKTLRDTRLSNPKHVDTNEERNIYNDIVNDDFMDNTEDGSESDEE